MGGATRGFLLSRKVIGWHGEDEDGIGTDAIGGEAGAVGGQDLDNTGPTCKLTGGSLSQDKTSNTPWQGDWQRTHWAPARMPRTRQSGRSPGPLTCFRLGQAPLLWFRGRPRDAALRGPSWKVLFCLQKPPLILFELRSLGVSYLARNVPAEDGFSVQFVPLRFSGRQRAVVHRVPRHAPLPRPSRSKKLLAVFPFIGRHCLGLRSPSSHLG